MSQGSQQVRSGVAVDRENPWPGLAPFTEAQREFFFGREEETAELLRRVRGKMLTVLFGQSGLGKTSLLCAGLSPRLREEDMIPIVVRLNHDPAAPPLADQVRKAIGQTIEQKLMDGPMPVAGQTLWEYFHGRELELWTPRNRPATAVILFDQFEEIYTLGRTNEQTRERGRAFSEELADLVENRPPAALRRGVEGSGELAEEEALQPFDFSGAPCKVVVSLREDYLPDLEGYRKQAPSIADNRIRLQMMNGQQALHVLCSAGGHLIDRATALRVVRFVGGAAEGGGGAGGAGDAREMEAGLEGLRIEPALLSIFAHELNRKRQALGLERITADLLEGHRDQIIGDFYERSLADLPAQVRPFIEDRLLTPSGYRDSLAMEIATGPGGLAVGLIDQLVARRLLHVDQRLGTQRLELTHDVLTGPVRASRDARQQGQAIKVAQEREREIAAKLARARRRLMLTSVLAVAMLGLAVFSYLSWQKSLRETARAEAERMAAEKSAGLATSSIEHTLMTLDWEEAVTVLSSMTADTNSANTAEILQGLAQKYRTGGRRTEEIRVRLWLAHVDPKGAETWIQANADELTTLLEELMARSDEAGWAKLEDFFSPAERAMCACLARRFPELAAQASPAELRAVVAIGQHARQPLWSAGKNNTWIVGNADALKKLLLDVMVKQDKAQWKDVVDFFEPAHDAILGRLIDKIGELVDTEDLNGKRLEAAIFFGARPRADSTAQAAVHTDAPKELSLGNPVQRAIDGYRQSHGAKAEPDPKELLARGMGLSTREFAFCQSLPLNDALKLTTILQKSGYQLRSFRPYNTQAGELRVTARWDTGPAEGTLRMDLTLEQAREQERQMFLEGYAPDDVTCYEVRGENGQPQERIALVCRKVGPVAPRYRLFLNTPEEDVRDNINKVIGSGFDLMTAQRVIGRDGDARFYGIATTDPRYQSSITRWEVTLARLGKQPADGGSEVLLDVRPEAKRRSDLKLWWERELAASVARLQAAPDNMEATLQKAQALLHLGRNKESVAALSSPPVDAKEPGQSVLYWRVIAKARLGDGAGAQADLEALTKLREATSPSLAYLSGIIAVCGGKPVPAEVEKLVTDNPNASKLYNAACVYAWAAGMPQRPADEREKLATRALEILRQGIKSGVDDSYGAWVDSDLMALQGRPEFAEATAEIPPQPYLNVTFLAVPRGVAVDDVLKLQQGTPAEILRNGQVQADAKQTLTGVAMIGEGANVASAALWAPEKSDVAGVISARAAASQAQLKTDLRKSLQYESLTENARKWWDDIESTNERNQDFVLEIMQSLAERKATIQEFYRAYLFSKAYNLRANLYFLDYLRSMKAFKSGVIATPSLDRYAAFGKWMEQKATVKVTDLHDWKNEQIVEQIKKDKEILKFSGTSAEARNWWDRLEAGNSHGPALMLRLIEEIGARNKGVACWNDLFEAAALAHCDDLLAQLQFMDYLNSKRTWDAANVSVPGGTARSAGLELLNSYARGRLMGLAVPLLPAVTGTMLTPGDLEAGINGWCAALNDYQGACSPDMVYFVSTACSALFRDALAHGVELDVPGTGARLAKAAYYSVDEKEVTLYLTVNLPAEGTLSTEARGVLAKAREKITQVYKDAIFKTIVDEKLGIYADAAEYRQHLPIQLQRQFEDLGSAYRLNDLKKAGELLEALRPGEAQVRGVLAEDVPAEALQQILAQRPPTVDEVGQHGLLGNTLDVRAWHTTFVQLRNLEMLEPIVKYLRPGTEFYAVEMGNNKTFYLIFWDGEAWRMLNPLWEIPGFRPAAASPLPVRAGTAPAATVPAATRP